ncbi:MAG: hypothetical protein NT039_00410 [Candidatus Berkelbacteria bacterium]|nr:hypothetical protein [Candidatus Berkelbacteria bacterium]
MIQIESSENELQRTTLRKIRTSKKIYYSPDPIADLAHLEEYYHSMQSIGVKVPKYYGGKINHQKKKIITQWEEFGEPIAQEIIHMSCEEVLDTLNKILNINYWGYLNRVALYPGLDSYSIFNKRIFFIDFFPAKRKGDFEKHGAAKQLVFSLIFFGLIQKISLPTKEIINLRPDLKSEIISSVLEFTEQWGLDSLKRDLKLLFNFRLPKNSKQKRKIDINFASGYDNIIYFNPQAKIISLSPKCVWTPYLLYRDMENCKKMGLLFEEF